VEDVGRLHDELREKGATIVHPPEIYRWACEMKVADPDGHVLRFGSDRKDREETEPGAVAAGPVT
jgi:uncharacterized glyoxalase superfamily protein PhnB